MTKLENSSKEVQRVAKLKYNVPSDMSGVYVGTDGGVFELFGKSRVALSLNTANMDLFHFHSGSVNQ